MTTETKKKPDILFTWLPIVAIFTVTAFLVFAQDDSDDVTNLSDRNTITGDQKKPSIRTSPAKKSTESTELVAAEKVSADVDSDGKMHIGYQVLDESNADDLSASKNMIAKYARNPSERKRLEHNHHCSKRQKAVKMQGSFRDLGRRLLRGENISKLNLPGFNGKDYEVSIIKQDFLTDTQGTLYGKIEGVPYSEVVMVYYEGSSTATLALPTENVHIEYEPHNDDIMMVYEVDQEKYAASSRCPHCESD